MTKTARALLAVGALVTLSGCAVHTHPVYTYVEPRPVYVAPVVRTYTYRPYYYHRHYHVPRTTRHYHYHYYR